MNYAFDGCTHGFVSSCPHQIVALDGYDKCLYLHVHGIYLYRERLRQRMPVLLGVSGMQAFPILTRPRRLPGQPALQLRPCLITDLAPCDIHRYVLHAHLLVLKIVDERCELLC